MVVGTILAWPALAMSRVDRAVAKGITALKVKPRIRVPVTKKTSSADNYNGSYAALGVRPGGVPGWTPAWLWNPVRRLGRGIAAIQTLKDSCLKGIVLASYSK